MLFYKSRFLFISILYCVFISDACIAQLKALDDRSLEGIVGASGIVVDASYQSKQDIAFTPDQDGALTDSAADFFLLFGESNLDFSFKGLTIDVIDRLGFQGGGVRIGLPNSITFNNFTTGISYISLDGRASSVAETYTGPLSVLPSIRPDLSTSDPSDFVAPAIFQLVATSTFAQSYYSDGIGSSTYDLWIEDVSRDASGNLTRTGNLKILNWDDESGKAGNFFDPNRNTDRARMTICNGSIPAAVSQNTWKDSRGCASGASATYEDPDDLPNGGAVVGNGAARLWSGYQLNTAGLTNRQFKEFQQGLPFFSSASYTPTTFESGGNGVNRDTRVLFSLDKVATVRMRMDLTDCDGDINQCRGPNALGDQKYTVIDPAIALLDKQGNVIDADTSAGPETPGFSLFVNSDTTVSALLELTLGPVYIDTIKDRRLGGFRVGAPPEQQLAAESEFSTLGYNTINSSANIQLGGGLTVFGRN